MKGGAVPSTDYYNTFNDKRPDHGVPSLHTSHLTTVQYAKRITVGLA